MKRHKYRAKRTEYAGVTYPSKAEAGYAAQLDLMQKAGELTSWHRPTAITLAPGVKYIPDFRVANNDGTDYYVDVKGVETPVFRLKMKLWEAGSFGELRIVKLKNGRYVTDRVVGGRPSV